MNDSPKKAVLYARVSTADQNLDTQLHDLRQLAAQRGLEIVHEYADCISGARSRRPGLDELMRDARRGRFQVVLVWAADRMARSVKHFLDVLDELQRLNIEFVSFRENLDTGGPLGRAVVTIVSVVAELERNLIVERVKAGMRRAKLEGRRIGRRPLNVDRDSIWRHHVHGRGYKQIAKDFGVSKTFVARIITEKKKLVPKGFVQLPSEVTETISTGSVA